MRRIFIYWMICGTFIFTSLPVVSMKEDSQELASQGLLQRRRAPSISEDFRTQRFPKHSPSSFQRIWFLAKKYPCLAFAAFVAILSAGGAIPVAMDIAKIFLSKSVNV